MTDFDAIWKAGPWLRLGKKAAQRHFNASVKTEQDLEALQTAIRVYTAHLALNTWKTPMHGSTFFNNWLDWVEFQEPAPRRPAHVHTAICREYGMCHEAMAEHNEQAKRSAEQWAAEEARRLAERQE